MIPAPVLAKSAALETLRARWEATLLPAVSAKVADAHAHAQKALTDALKATTDGRPSLLKLNASPSLKAAYNRLDELREWLAGPSETSQRGKVRDFREAAYRLACELWLPMIPPEYLSRNDHPPTQAEVRMIRAFPVHGYDIRRVLDGPIDTAKRELKAALERAGRRGVAEGSAADTLAAWEHRAAGSLSRAVVTLLNDSAEHANTEAGKALIHPDFIEGD